MESINSIKLIKEDINENSSIFLVGEDIFAKTDEGTQSINKYSIPGLYLSNAVDILERRDYNIPIVPIVSKDGIQYKKGQNLDSEDLVMINEEKLNLYNTKNSELKSQIDKKSGSIIDYSSSKFELNFQKDIMSIDLVDESEYRNTIDISNLGTEIKEVYDSISRVEVGVEITIKGKYYNETNIFEAFSLKDYRGSKLFAWNDFVSDKDLYTIEFINGIIRVVPLTNDVDECIINHCVLTYGRNKN